jgi:hypothetical protein
MKWCKTTNTCIPLSSLYSEIPSLCPSNTTNQVSHPPKKKANYNFLYFHPHALTRGQNDEMIVNVKINLPKVDLRELECIMD